MAKSRKNSVSDPDPSNIQHSMSQESGSLVFISHDTRNAVLTEEFSKLLASVSAGVLKSFRSSDQKGSQGIEYGVEWYPELMKKLNSASDVVCLLTKNSIDRPWILYEAGVAKGKLDTPVSGVALGIPLSRANSGPFAQFQNLDDGVDSLTKLIVQLVKKIPGADPSHDVIKLQVESFKKAIEKPLKTLMESNESVSNSTVQEARKDEPVAKLFEEIKVMFQDLPSRIGCRSDSPRENRKQKFRKFHPMMLEELLDRHFDSNPAISLLFLASFFHDDIPWIYEIIMELYRAISAKKYSRARNLIFELKQAHKSSSLRLISRYMDVYENPVIERFLFEMPIFLEKILIRSVRFRNPKEHGISTVVLGEDEKIVSKRK